MALNAEQLLGWLRRHGVDFACGVPCSLLAPLMSRLIDCPELAYTAAASEGEAVAVAAGAWLGGRFGLVCLQNSGLGNAVNPLTSLVATHAIPMLLLVGHRGHDGRDAPQHQLMGAITEQLLETLRVRAERLPSQPCEAEACVAGLLDWSREHQRPVALLVRPGVLAPEPADGSAASPIRAAHAAPVGRVATAASTASAAPVAPCVHDEDTAPDARAWSTAGRPPPTRRQVLAALLAALQPDDLLISTTGRTSRELFALGDRPGNFYMPGSMGCAPAIGLGTSLACPERRVIVIDGDGALLMKAGVLASIGAARPPGLLHLLLDNGCYESTGGQPSAATGVDFPGLATACGYPRSLALGDEQALGDLVRHWSCGDGPTFASLIIAAGHEPGVGRPGRSPLAVRNSFREAAGGQLPLA